MGASIIVCVSLFKLGMLFCSSKCPFTFLLNLRWLMLKKFSLINPLFRGYVKWNLHFEINSHQVLKYNEAIC